MKCLDRWVSNGKWQRYGNVENGKRGMIWVKESRHCVEVLDGRDSSRLDNGGGWKVSNGWETRVRFVEISCSLSMVCGLSLEEDEYI